MIVFMGHSNCFHFLDGCDKMLLLYLYAKWFLLTAYFLYEEKGEKLLIFIVFSLMGISLLPFHSIEYWPEPQRGIKEAYRVLKQGGKACLIGPVYPTFWLSRFFADVWMLFPKEEEYIEWFEKAGFTDVQLKRIGPKWYRGVRRHGLIMGCSVTGVKPASGDSPLQVTYCYIFHHLALLYRLHDLDTPVFLLLWSLTAWGFTYLDRYATDNTSGTFHFVLHGISNKLCLCIGSLVLVQIFICAYVPLRPSSGGKWLG